MGDFFSFKLAVLNCLITAQNVEIGLVVFFYRAADRCLVSVHHF